MPRKPNAARIADELRLRFKQLEPPINVAPMLDEFGIRFEEDPRLRKALIIGPPGARVFRFNPYQPKEERRPQAAHELAHFLLGHDVQQFKPALARRGRGSDSIQPVADEQDADAFTFHLLTPREWVTDQIRALIRGKTELACRAGVSPRFMWNALEFHKLSDLCVKDDADFRRFRESPRWRQITMDVLARRSACEYRGCAKDCYETRLDVHHVICSRYWNPREEDLIVLCREHHLFAHGRRDDNPDQLRLIA